jgi:hypothetical protein
MKCAGGSENGKKVAQEIHVVPPARDSNHVRENLNKNIYTPYPRYGTGNAWYPALMFRGSGYGFSLDPDPQH